MTYTISGKHWDPGVWGFAFEEKKEAEAFAEMATRLSFEAYKLTGNLVGFSGCEGLVLYMFETTSDARGGDSHKLYAAFCNGRMSMTPAEWGGGIHKDADALRTVRNSIRRALKTAVSENGYENLLTDDPKKVAADLAEFEADLGRFFDSTDLLAPYVEEWQREQRVEDEEQGRREEDVEAGNVKHFNERSPV